MLSLIFGLAIGLLGFAYVIQSGISPQSALRILKDYLAFVGFVSRVVITPVLVSIVVAWGLSHFLPLLLAVIIGLLSLPGFFWIMFMGEFDPI